MTRKKHQIFPLTETNKKNITFFSVNTNHISAHVLEISAIPLVLRTDEITDIFNTSDEIYLVFTIKSYHPLSTSSNDHKRIVKVSLKISRKVDKQGNSCLNISLS